MSLRQKVWTHAPLGLLKAAVGLGGGFRAKEKLGFVQRPWYAYGLLAAADLAGKLGKKEIYAIEFGVAAGRGIRNLVELSGHVSRETGVSIRVAGFDTGSGMPPPTDYRDHPERYQHGDFPMVDYEALMQKLNGSADLVIGEIDKTIDAFRQKLSDRCPVGFIAVDVDAYTSSKAALRLFDGGPELYLPMCWCYFDDCSSRSHFNRFTGELLAIDEFNQENQMRKLDIDRGAWNAHRRLGPQLWYERMYILHVFDHPWRSKTDTRAPKIINAV